MFRWLANLLSGKPTRRGRGRVVRVVRGRYDAAVTTDDNRRHWVNADGLSANAAKTEQVALYVAEARSMGVPVLAPEINASSWDFAIEDVDGKPNIRFGLGAIKNVGQAAVQLAIDERKRSGRFVNLNDFARRVDLRAVGKRALECLIKVGALEDLREGEFNIVLGSDLARALGKVPKKGDHYENDEYVISSAVGHLVGLQMPEDIDKKKYGFWRLETLPIIPDEFELMPLPDAPWPGASYVTTR